VRAQQAKLPTIGFLGANTRETQGRWTTTFVRRLGELGWTEGRNMVTDYRWADGRRDRAAEAGGRRQRIFRALSKCGRRPAV
jgi:putative tryptophan/tyrosine transport system substrate-binding protein